MLGLNPPSPLKPPQCSPSFVIHLHPDHDLPFLLSDTIIPAVVVSAAAIPLVIVNMHTGSSPSQSRRRPHHASHHGISDPVPHGAGVGTDAVQWKVVRVSLYIVVTEERDQHERDQNVEDEGDAGRYQKRLFWQKLFVSLLILLILCSRRG